jgi:YihY family inner membrane protein
MAKSAPPEPPIQLNVQRDRSPSTFAGVAAAAGTVGATIGALVIHRLSRNGNGKNNGNGNGKRPELQPDPADADADVDARPTEAFPPTAFPPTEGTDTKGDAAARPPNKSLAKIDGFQRAHPAVGFPFAVVKKFGDDSAGSLAALIAYYGMLSLFPLLLALTTLLATVLSGHPELQRRILSSALTQFPVIGDQLRTNVHSLHGTGLGLAIGIAGALWGGMGVMKAAGQAMDDLWEVPKRDRPKFIKALTRAALLLIVLGAGVVATTALSGLGTSGSDTFLPLKIAGLVAAALVNIGLFVLGFRVLTVREVKVGDLLPGAIVAGLGWLALQAVGGYYVNHQLKNMTQTYGTFAIVIGLLSWLYLLSQLTLLSAEVNVVRRGRLWPRTLAGHLTDADKRAYSSYAEVEERRPDEDVGVGFDDRPR